MLKPKLLLLSDQAPTLTLPARSLLKAPLPSALYALNGKLLQCLPIAAYALSDAVQVLQFQDSFLSIDVPQLMQRTEFSSTAIQSCYVAPLQFNVMRDTVDLLERGLVYQTLHFDGKYLCAYRVSGTFLVASSVETAFFVQMMFNGEFRRFYFKTVAEVYLAAFDGSMLAFADKDYFVTCCEVHNLGSQTEKRKIQFGVYKSAISAIAVCSALDMLFVGFEDGRICFVSIAGDVLYECDLTQMLGFKSPIQHIMCSLQYNYLHVFVLAQKTPPLIISLTTIGSVISYAYFCINPMGIVHFKHLNDAILLALLRRVDLWQVPAAQDEYECLKTVHEAVFYDFPYPLAHRRVNVQMQRLEALFCVARYRTYRTNEPKSEDFAVFESLLRQQLICARKFVLAEALDADSLYFMRLFREPDAAAQQDICNFATPIVEAASGSQFGRFLSGDLSSACDQFRGMSADYDGQVIL